MSTKFSCQFTPWTTCICCFLWSGCVLHVFQIKSSQIRYQICSFCGVQWSGTKQSRGTL